MDRARRVAAGGIRGLVELIREHGRAVEADLRSEYHVRLRDFWSSDLTWRELWTLITELPPDSRLAQELTGPHWSIEAHLLDTLRMVWTHSDRNPAQPHPDRPTAEKRRQASPEWQAKVADARTRARARRQKIESGEL